MKVAVVGCGAIGSVYAALLADAGHEVWAIDRWKEHVDAMRKNGLRVEGASGDQGHGEGAAQSSKSSGSMPH